MKKLTKTLALLLAMLLATALFSCTNDNDTDIPLNAETTAFGALEEGETTDSEPFAEPIPDAVEVKDAPEYEPTAVKLEDIPYDTAPIDSEISYVAEFIEAGFDVEFLPDTEDYTYYLSIYNLGDEAISVPSESQVHAYVGNGEWVRIIFGDDSTLELFYIEPGSSITVRYFPYKLPQGTYRGVMSYTTESGEEGYFSFDYVTKK